MWFFTGHNRMVAKMARPSLTLQTITALLACGGTLFNHATGLQTSTLSVFFDSTNNLHRDVAYHPEQPARISACVKALREYQQTELVDTVWKRTIEIYDVSNDPVPIDGVSPDPLHMPFSAQELDHARNMLLQTHDPELVLRLEERCNASKARRLEENKPALGHIGYLDSGDTYVTTETFDVCLRATAAWIRAADHAMCASASDESANGNSSTPNHTIRSHAFALTRPPGHHATTNLSNGFCLFNFAAAAATHVLQQGQGQQPRKVSILDWDVHYGQGVSNIVRKLEEVRYVSIHQTPAFPYEGESMQTIGPHQNVMTIPMLPGIGWQTGYKQLFEKALDFVCQQGKWEPDIVIVCAGYDALGSDELASCCLTAKDYGEMTRMLCDRIQSLSISAKKNKKIGLMFGLEGGYQLAEGVVGGNLPEAVVETARSVLGQSVAA